MASDSEAAADEPAGGEGAAARAASRWAPLASVILFLALSAYQADKPLHLDNMDFPAAAEAVVDTGWPIYYRGEWTGRPEPGQWRPSRWSGAPLGEAEWAALYHPPLYVYLLAGWFAVLGKGAMQARLFGALCAVLLCWLTVRLSRLLSLRSREFDWAIWPIVLLQAYTLQASGIVDIDTSIYGPLLVGLATAAIYLARRSDRPLGWRVVLLGALIAVVMWAELTTIWLLVAAMPALLHPRLRLGRSLLVTAASSAVGVVLFLATFLPYCLLADLDPRDTYRFLVASFQRGGAVPPYLDNLRATAPFVVRWTGLLPWLAAPIAFTPWFARAFALDRGARLQLRALLSVALVGSVYYMAQTRTFGNAPFKYVFVFWPLVLLPLAMVVGDAASRLLAPGRGAAPGVVTLVVASAAGLFVAARIGDAHLQLGAEVSAVALAMLALPAVLALGATAGWLERGPDRGTALAWLAAAGLQTDFQTGVALVQVRAPYSTDYDYGQMGLDEAIAYVRANTGPDEVISSMKDLGFQARRRFIETYQPLYTSERRAGELIEAWEDGSVRLIVFTDGIGQDQAAVRPALADWISRNAELVASPGHYRIYRPVRRPAAEGSGQ